MEEKKQQTGKTEQKKLSYEELSQVASDLHMSNQKLYARVQELQNILNSRDFEYSSFFLNSLFKVVEHAEMYDEEFVNWTVGNIKSALVAFVENAQKEEPKQDENGKAE